MKKCLNLERWFFCILSHVFTALVDPGKLDFHFGKVGPVAYRKPTNQQDSNKRMGK